LASGTSGLHNSEGKSNTNLDGNKAHELKLELSFQHNNAIGKKSEEKIKGISQNLGVFANKKFKHITGC